jgi:hypothetical protein
MSVLPFIFFERFIQVPSDIVWSVLIALRAIVALGTDNVKFLLQIESDHKNLSACFPDWIARQDPASTRKIVTDEREKSPSCKAQTATNSQAADKRPLNNQ